MFRYSCLALLLLVFFVLPLHSQQPGKPTGYLATYRAAEKLFYSESANETTDSLAYSAYLRVITLLKAAGRFNEILVDSYSKCGILQMSKNNNDKALTYFRDATASWQHRASLPDSLLFRPYLYTGSIRHNMNELDSALYYYKKAEAITTRNPAISESERLYNKLGVLYYETDDYQRSINYYEKALSIVSEKKPVNIYFFVNYKNNIATALLKMQLYNQAIAIYKDLLKYHINTDQIYSNIATINYEQGAFPEALQYFQLIKENSAEKYNHLTMVLLKMKQYAAAASYNIKSFALSTNIKSNHKGIDYILTLKYAGDLQMATGDIPAAIRYYQSAIIMLVPGFTDTVIAKNPLIFTGLPNFSMLFDILTAKGDAFNILHNNESSANHKKNALAAYTSALALARYAERTYSSDDARLFLKNKVNPACSAAVTLALELYNANKDPHYLSAAFGYIENNKASVLQAGIQQFESAGIAGLPAALLADEKKYKLMIARLTIQLSQVKDTISQTLLQEKLRDTEVLLSGVQQKLDDNPSYRRLKFSTKDMSLEKIHQQLAVNGNEAVLSYYYTTTQLLCFYVTPAATGYSSVALTADFFAAVKNLRKELEAPDGGDRKQADNISRVLFRFLLQPVSEIIKDKSRLVIVPYNEISYVPFELLKNDGDGSLLLNKFAVSYNYSANFLFDAADNGKERYNVLAMAPFTGNQTAVSILPELSSSEKEVAGLPGKLFTGANATRARFIALCSQYPVIHLATHAVANDKNPLGCYIEFYGEKKDADTMHRLYEKEIYNLDMQQARLVILSACETGNGLLVNGEGIESLSRAFSYAGCKSVITSLWKADDEATAFIMERLHVYLQKGFSKDVALQKAKLDYLNNPGTEDRYKLPSYWAHLVLIGNQQPVMTGHFQWFIPILLLAGLFLGMFLIYLYKTKRAQ